MLNPTRANPWMPMNICQVAIWQGPLAQVKTERPFVRSSRRGIDSAIGSGACLGRLPSHGVPLIFRRRSRQHVP